MRLKKFILLFFFAIGCGTYTPLDNRYVKYDHIYYFDTQLRNLENHGFERGERYQYGMFDHKSASLNLISADGNWEVKKVLMLKELQEDLFLVDNYPNFLIYFRPSGVLVFIKDKINAKPRGRIIDTGGALEELTSIEACKEHAAKVKKEQEEFTTSPGQE